jgi:hypothetical protein
VTTALALELAAGGGFLRFKATALGADRITIGFGPAHFAECGVCGIFTIFVDGAHAQGPSRC